MHSTRIRTAGATLLAGSLTWAVTAAVSPSNSTHNSRIELAGGLAFQVGLSAYLAVVSWMRAAGDRWGQRFVTAESVVLLLAAIWSVGAIANPSIHEGAVLSALDAAWPLSMVGLIVVGAAIAKARRFPGATRWLPLLASGWLVADVLGRAVHISSYAIHLVWLSGPYGLLALAMISRLAPAPVPSYSGHTTGQGPHDAWDVAVGP